MPNGNGNGNGGGGYIDPFNCCGQPWICEGLNWDWTCNSATCQCDPPSGGYDCGDICENIASISTPYNQITVDTLNIFVLLVVNLATL